MHPALHKRMINEIMHRCSDDEVKLRCFNIIQKTISFLPCYQAFVGYYRNCREALAATEERRWYTVLECSNKQVEYDDQNVTFV